MGQDDSVTDRPEDRLTPEHIRIPSLRLIRELGRGGMGVVFLAEQVSLGREVAVKVFPAQGVKETNLKRFFREVQLCVSLSHPNVVKLLDAGATDDWAWLAMECIDGQPLDHHVYTYGAMKPTQLAVAMEELADALDFVHEHKIVHRDIKPANVMKPKNGGLKLMDFGLARMEASATLTDSGAVVGSPRYLAPETVTAGTMDIVTDLYGLGFLFYEISTATRPYDKRTLRETLAGIVREELPPPSSHEPSIPSEMDRIIMKLLAKNREQRYQTTQELLADVRRLRVSADFVGTSWETSRPSLDLLGSAADLIKPTGSIPPVSVAPGSLGDTVKSDPRSNPGSDPRPRMGSRPSRRTPAVRPTGSFAVAAPSAARFSTATILGMAAVIGAGIGIATIALVHARRNVPAVTLAPVLTSTVVNVAPPPTKSGAKPIAVLVDLLATPIAEKDAPSVVAQIEANVGKRPSQKPALLPEWNKHAAEWLLTQPFAIQWRQITSHFERSTLLEDTSIPIAVRRRLYNAALFYLHLDDFVATQGQEPPFGAEALVRPWHADVDSPGRTREDLREISARAPVNALVISNVDDGRWYAFFDEKGAADDSPVHLMAGPAKRKYEDESQPELVVSGPGRTVTLRALTRFLFDVRYFQLDLRPVAPADGDIQVRTVVMRGRPAVKGPDKSAITGTRVSADLVPPGKYHVRIRAFRMVGEENWGMCMDELRAELGP